MRKNKEKTESISQARPAQPELAVWYGSMPESNGKKNWTAILYRKDEGWTGSGITIDRSEYPDRVRYEADRMRYLIGELPEEPWILDYDGDKREPAVPVVVREGAHNEPVLYPTSQWVRAFFGTPDENGHYAFQGNFRDVAHAYDRAQRAHIEETSAVSQERAASALVLLREVMPILNGVAAGQSVSAAAGDFSRRIEAFLCESLSGKPEGPEQNTSPHSRDA